MMTFVVAAVVVIVTGVAVGIFFWELFTYALDRWGKGDS